MDIPSIIREKARDFKESELQDYVQRVHKLLEDMLPGQQLPVNKLTRESNRDLFIECVKLYIRKMPYQGGIMFNADFTIIKKYDVKM
jgi:hypothetical protein